MSSTSASIEWYALRSCASSGDHRARSFRVAAVIAMLSILMSISGIGGVGDEPKSVSNDGTVRAAPVVLSTVSRSAIAIDTVVEAPMTGTVPPFDSRMTT